jgi:hypothetical protein
VSLAWPMAVRAPEDGDRLPTGERALVLDDHGACAAREPTGEADRATIVRGACGPLARACVSSSSSSRVQPSCPASGRQDLQSTRINQQGSSHHDS